MHPLHAKMSYRLIQFASVIFYAWLHIGPRILAGGVKTPVSVGHALGGGDWVGLHRVSFINESGRGQLL